MLFDSLFSILLILVTGTQSINFGRKQSAGATGRLVCHGAPASEVLVKLYDHDTVSADDLMDIGHTDENGNFQLSGFEYELLSINPKINIYFNCDDGLIPCERKISIYLPSTYVSTGDRPERLYNLGVLELSGRFDDEERDCIH